MAELILFAEVLTDQQILDVNAYLGGKWGITVAGGGNAAAGLALVQGAAVIPEPSTFMLAALGPHMLKLCGAVLLEDAGETEMAAAWRDEAELELHPER